MGSLLKPAIASDDGVIRGGLDKELMFLSTPEYEKNVYASTKRLSQKRRETHTNLGRGIYQAWISWFSLKPDHQSSEKEKKAKRSTLSPSRLVREKAKGEKSKSVLLSRHLHSRDWTWDMDMDMDIGMAWEWTWTLA